MYLLPGSEEKPPTAKTGTDHSERNRGQCYNRILSNFGDFDRFSAKIFAIFKSDQCYDYFGKAF
jgi:hypothetical protein